MLEQLLHMPHRRTTILPELVRFFREQVDSSAEDLLSEFCREFAGTTIECPTHRDIEELRRDTEIVDKLRRGVTVELLVAILREHEVSYSYVADLHRLCLEREMAIEGGPITSNDRVAAAASWSRRYPRMAGDFVAMFRLDSREHASMGATVGRTADGSRPLSNAQIKVLRTIMDAGRAIKPQEVGRRLGHGVHERTIQVLVDGQYVTITKTGRLKLTTKGKKL